MKLKALVTLAFIFVFQFLSAQELELNPQKLADELDEPSYRKDKLVDSLIKTLNEIDSIRAFRFLNELAEKGKSKGYHFQARFNSLKATTIYIRDAYYVKFQDRKNIDQVRIKQELIELYSSAIDIAYRSEDDYLIAYTCHLYSSVITLFGEVGLGVMYAKSSIDVHEKLSYPILPGRYQFLAELLYRVREYNECIRYGKKAVAAWQASPNEFKSFTMSSMNTVALGYHRQHLYDSAFTYYNKALDLAKQIKDTVWTGIVSGNMGQILYAQGKYDTAYTLLKGDYKASIKAGYYDNAANSLQWAARTNLALGNKAEALMEVREAFQLLKLWPDANYSRNAYYTVTQIFREMGNYDSAFYYNNLYTAINDSLEKVVATSSLAISKAKLNDEASRYAIQTLNREKKTQLLQRNIIIAGIIILSIIALLVINRKRLQTKLRMEVAEQEKLRMTQEVASANVQMEMFTKHLIEKTSLVEKLEQQVHGRELSREQQEIISELSRQTILTEEDWLKFKSLFEKIHPGFFINLQEKVSDITVAELRMAALTRLHLSTNQIASILGISANSVYKTKQRLRQRLNIEGDKDIEDAIAKI